MKIRVKKNGLGKKIDILIFLPIVQFLDFLFAPGINDIPVFMGIFSTFFILKVIFNFDSFFQNLLRMDIMVHLLIMFIIIAELISLFYQNDYTIKEVLFDFIGIGVIFIITIYYSGDYNSHITKINSMMYVYMIICILFAVYRIANNGMILDLLLLRSGVYIFGSNTALAFFYGVAVLNKICSRNKNYYLFLAIASLGSVLYISRGGFLIGVLLWGYEIIKSKNRDRKLTTTYIIILIILSVVIFISFPEVIERIFSMFDQLKTGTFYAENSRNMIREVALNSLNNNPSILIKGLGIDHFRSYNSWGYSDPHNTLLDVVFLGGILLLCVFLCLLVKVLIGIKSKLIFILFIIYTVYEGIALTHMRDAVISAYLLMIIIWISNIALCKKSNSKMFNIGEKYV